MEPVPVLVDVVVQHEVLCHRTVDPVDGVSDPPQKSGQIVLARRAEWVGLGKWWTSQPGRTVAIPEASQTRKVISGKSARSGYGATEQSLLAPPIIQPSGCRLAWSRRVPATKVTRFADSDTVS